MKKIPDTRSGIAQATRYRNSAVIAQILFLMLFQPEAVMYSLFNGPHGASADAANVPAKPLFVDGPNLLQQCDGAPVQRVVVEVNVGIHAAGLALACNWRYDGRGAAEIVSVGLDDEHGAFAALLRAKDGIKLRVENFPSSDWFHMVFLFLESQAALSCAHRPV